MTHDTISELVQNAGRAARAAAPSLAAAPESALTAALERMSARLGEQTDALLAANTADVAALDPSFPEAMRDRLRLDADRIAAMARQIDAHHVLYLNLEGQPKQIGLKGKSRSILHDRDYQEGFSLAPYDAEFVELE